MYLNCHTWFSLRYGTFSEEELCSLAESNSITTVTVTDINNTSACLKFLKIAPSYGIKPLVGIDFRNQHQCLYVGIAKNRNGYLQLNRYLSEHLHQKKDFPESAPELEDCYFIYPFKRALQMPLTVAQRKPLIGVGVKDINRFKFSKFNTEAYKEQLVFLQTVTVPFGL